MKNLKYLLLVMALGMSMTACGSGNKSRNMEEKAEQKDSEAEETDDEEEPDEVSLELDETVELHGLKFKVSSEWRASVEDDTHNYYPEDVDMVQFNAAAVAGYSEYSEEQKEAAIEVLSDSLIGGFDGAEVLAEKEDKLDGNFVLNYDLKANLNDEARKLYLSIIPYGDYIHIIGLVVPDEEGAADRAYLDQVMDTIEFMEPEILETTLGPGSTFEFDDLEITFGSEIQWHTLENRFSDKNGADVFSIDVKVKNLSDDTHKLNMFYYTHFGPAGTKLDSVSSYFNKEDIAFSGDMRSGAEQETKMFFLYDGDGDYFIEFKKAGTDTIEVKIPVQK